MTGPELLIFDIPSKPCVIKGQTVFAGGSRSFL